MFYKNNFKTKTRIVLALFSLAFFAVALLPYTGYSSGVPVFNEDPRDRKTLEVGNRTQDVTWRSTISANPGDDVSFAVYYHNNTEGTLAKDTRIRIDYPCSPQGRIVPTAYLWASNASLVSDTAVINVTDTPQKLIFEDTARWYPDRGSTAVNIPIEKVGACSALVNIGDIEGCWPYQGYVVFDATLTDYEKEEPEGSLSCYSETEDSIRLSYDFKDGSSASLFRGNTRLSILGSGDRSGTYRDTGLSPDTSYTYYLRDGTSTSSPRLARVVCRTEKEKVDPRGDLECYSETETSIRLWYEFEDGSSASLFRGSRRLSILGSGDRSGTYRDTGLSPDTSYTYYLRDGTSTSSLRLARVVCRTDYKDKEEELSVTKRVKSVDRDTIYTSSLNASPGELLNYSIRITARDAEARDVFVKDTLTTRLIYDGNLRVDGSRVSGDIESGIKIGDIPAGEYKTVTFDVRVAGEDRFLIGTTSLTNVARAESRNASDTGSATVRVERERVVTPPTEVPTGITGNTLLDYVVLPFLLAVVIFILFKKHFIALTKKLDEAGKEIRESWQ